MSQKFTKKEVYKELQINKNEVLNPTNIVEPISKIFNICICSLIPDYQSSKG